MKYFGGCDVGSTYTKAVILDENGKMCADTTIRSKINAEQSAIAAMQEVCDTGRLQHLGAVPLQSGPPHLPPVASGQLQPLHAPASAARRAMRRCSRAARCSRCSLP